MSAVLSPGILPLVQRATVTRSGGIHRAGGPGPAGSWWLWVAAHGERGKEREDGLRESKPGEWPRPGLFAGAAVVLQPRPYSSQIAPRLGYNVIGPARRSAH